ncbi:MAG TPA: DoxX family protein [Armatimonadota bacterium]|mgnify:CR=1 FL=1|nr:DoxX family protein [Armatimonadota bacterium]
MMRTLEAWYQIAAPYVLSIVRIVAALLFMQHGGQKLLGFPPGGHGMPDPFTLSWVAGMLELVGGGLLALGVFTRPVAFLLSGQMAVAYFMAHAPRGVFPAANGGELAALYCFVFFYLWFAGAGPISIDWLFRRQAAPVEADIHTQ